MSTTSLQIIGWKEWAVFPEINHERINMKVDTGAQTSCLHVLKVEPYQVGSDEWVKVWFQPEQDSEREVVKSFAVFDRRRVKSSGGHTTQRYVIKTPVQIGMLHFEIELTLTSRTDMRYRMLLGRQALSKRFLVDSSVSYLLGE
ncbi:ATP-dependent zinc protease [Shewanella intestini]|uniref:ATP-dependent zinc protease n=1 Tax=Shewanella intestini TaxID=2017544 RepID=A0ABS5I0A6_9GAMM|nr:MULTISPECIES: RimK/LysX family protein [Shewanella]MBR9727356.1 ATP-dependent zinc protease [Shewanella intestini]MRG35594.1 ATP-dependent zinc protease [Shewanella sp. XMDDZSB0408]